MSNEAKDPAAPAAPLTGAAPAETAPAAETAQAAGTRTEAASPLHLDEYRRKLEAQFAEWGVHIDELKARVQKAAGDARTALEGEYERLKTSEAADRLTDLREAGEEGWEQVKGHLDKLVEELKQAVGTAASALRVKKAGGQAPPPAASDDTSRS